MRIITSLMLAAIIITPAAAFAKQKTLFAPIAFQVERVVDGDTFQGVAKTWIKQKTEMTIRLRSVDTPELNSKCQNEKLLAKQAKDFAVNWFAEHKQIVIVNIETDYDSFGRVVADIRELSSGQSLSEAMLNNGLAKPYGIAWQFDCSP